MHRFLEARYSDADVLALYMKYREERIGPFVREIGDFIAHTKRNRGATLDRTAYMFSQVAFFQKYQGTNKVALDFFGECAWWLKPWFLGKIESEPMSVLKQVSGFGKKDLVKEVVTWFEGRDVYPTKLVCKNPNLFYALATRFSGKLSGQEVFSAQKMRKEVADLLKREGIPHSEIEPVIVATAILLQRKSAEIVSGFSANVSLSIDPQRSERVSGMAVPQDATGHRVRMFPDGNLKISVSTDNKNGDGMIAVGLDLVDTGIDTEKYFCRSLVGVDDHGFPRLDLSGNLTFERNAESMVFPA
jgi:hypothetical protein